MPKKALKCIVDVKVHVISCPGVWLCSKGEAYLTLAMFGLEYQSKLLTPVFPLYVYEKYRFEKTFKCCTDPADVALALEDEGVYIELIQLCPDRKRENVLATYHTTVRQFLFPMPPMRPRYTSSERELLLCITSNFPGILSPKLEFCTSTVIKESGVPSSKSTEKSSCSRGLPSSRPAKYRGSSSPINCPNPSPPPSPCSSIRCASHPLCTEEIISDSKCVVCRLYKKYFGKPYLGHAHCHKPGCPPRCKSPTRVCQTPSTPEKCSSDSTLDVCDKPPFHPCCHGTCKDDCCLNVPKWYYRYLLNEALEKNYQELYDHSKCTRWS